MRSPSILLSVLVSLPWRCVLSEDLHTCFLQVAAQQVSSPARDARLAEGSTLEGRQRTAARRSGGALPASVGPTSAAESSEADSLLAVARTPSPPSSQADFEFVDSNTSPRATELLRANEPWVINATICGIVLAVAVITSFGCLLGGQRWVPAMVLASYAVLLPGLVSKDFSFNIAGVVSGVPLLPSLRRQITRPRGLPGPIRESTRSVVPLLWDTGSRSGAVLIALFAFVVPVAKLLLLGLGELWRNRPEPWRVRVARGSIVVVQLISKWASPDMFAFALLYYLLRSLHHPPFLESIQVLDVGFACYNVFCVSSVVSTLSVTLPPLPETKAQGPAGDPLSVAARALGRRGLGPVALLLTSAWAAFFLAGILRPCLSMRLDLNTVMEKMHLPGALETLVEAMHLEDIVNTNVSIWRAARTLWGWFCGSGELNLLLGAVMLGGFGISLTAVDMALLLTAALGMATGGSRLGRLAGLALRAAHVAKHLAMLDVCAAGVVVVSFAASIYEEQGMIISLMRGVCYLIASEAFHYLTFHLVSAVAESTKVDTGP